MQALAPEDATGTPEGGLEGGLGLDPSGPEGAIEPGNTPAATPGLAAAPRARAQPPLRALPPTPALETINPEVPAHEGECSSFWHVLQDARQTPPCRLQQLVWSAPASASMQHFAFPADKVAEYRDVSRSLVAARRPGPCYAVCAPTAASVKMA